jgi:hypothetical protein
MAAAIDLNRCHTPDAFHKPSWRSKYDLPLEIHGSQVQCSIDPDLLLFAVFEAVFLHLADLRDDIRALSFALGALKRHSSHFLVNCLAKTSSPSVLKSDKKDEKFVDKR